MYPHNSENYYWRTLTLGVAYPYKVKDPLAMLIDIDEMLARSDEKIAKLKGELQLEELFRKRLLEETRHLPQERNTTPIRGSGEATPATNVGHRLPGTIVEGSLLFHVRAVLEQEQRPMRAREIADLVEGRGYSTQAKGGLPIAVSSLLAHDKGKNFLKVSPGVYELIREEEAQSGGSTHGDGVHDLRR